MAPIKVKKAYENHIIGFNNSSLPLGSRSDLHLLYEKAKRTNNQHWLSMFETAPSEKELDDQKGREFLDKQAAKP